MHISTHFCVLSTCVVTNQAQNSGWGVIIKQIGGSELICAFQSGQYLMSSIIWLAEDLECTTFEEWYVDSLRIFNRN